MQQGRWVSYIYRYRNNIRCENAGYIKVWHITHSEKTLGYSDQAQIRIGLKLHKKEVCRCRVFLLYKSAINTDAEGGSGETVTTRARYVTDICSEPENRDMLIKRFNVPWENALSDGKPFYEYDGLLFLCDDGEILTGLWDEYEFKVDDILIDVDENKEKKNREENRENNEKEDTNKPDVTAGIDEANEPGVTDGIEGADEEDVTAGIEDTNEPDVTIGIEKADKADVTTGIEKADKADATAGIEGADESDVTAEIEETNKPDVTAGIEGANEPDGVNETEEIARALEDDISNSCPVDKIISTYPKLPVFIDSPFTECVKIVPQDIGMLNMKNWKLGNNSFLAHGYYNYRYLMLGKIKTGKGKSNERAVNKEDNRNKDYSDEISVIGVPGVFTNKEKYLANMFGFRTFVPVKKTDVLMGNFGYWVVEVVRE